MMYLLHFFTDTMRSLQNEELLFIIGTISKQDYSVSLVWIHYHLQIFPNTGGVSFQLGVVVGGVSTSDIQTYPNVTAIE